MRRIVLIILTILFAYAGPLHAQQQSNEQIVDAAYKAAIKTMIKGPKTVILNEHASIKIGQSEVFIPKAEADGIMVALGNPSDPARVGMVVPWSEDAAWMLDVRWIKEGYVSDEDAKEWNADDLLKNLKDGTEEANKERIQRGITPLHVTGWIEPPAYNAATHQLVWSLAAQAEGAKPDQPSTVNYNTYALGREGFFSLNLITDSANVDREKAIAKRILGDLQYTDGKRYADFNASTDKVAAYGLAALVGGAALKKTGILAALGLILVKSWKVLIFGGGAALVALFRRKRKNDDEANDPEGREG